MSARETILANIMANQPVSQDLPQIDLQAVIHYDNVLQQFKTVLESIGGKTLEIKDWQELQAMMESDQAAGNGLSMQFQNLEILMKRFQL